MRITGGELRGRQLEVPPEDVLRPTQDRVRQAFFNIIGPRIVGAAFLDLFAGTGAVGIEAWSRGAGSVVLVESGRQVLPTLRRNIEHLCPERASIWKGTADQYVKSGGGGAAFDLIYADPPYGSRFSLEGKADGSGLPRRESGPSSGKRPPDIALGRRSEAQVPSREQDDPRLPIVHQSLNAIYSSPLLKPGGMVVWECRADMNLDPGEKWNLLQTREYGGTKLLFLSPRKE